MSISGYKRNEDAIKGNSKSNVYSFKNGKTVLRILPAYSDRGVWFRPISEYFFNLGDQKIFLTSPKDSGGRDPIAEHVSKLYKSGDEKLVEQAKKFRARKRFLVNALVLSDPDGTTLKDGVKVVGLPVRAKEELVEYDTDAEEGYADITNIETGRNVTIEKSGEGLNTRYSVRAQPKESNIIDLAKDQGVDVTSFNLNNLDEFVKPSSFEDLQTTLTRVIDFEFGPKSGDNIGNVSVQTQTGFSVTSGQTEEQSTVNISKVEAPTVPPPWEE